MEALVRDIMAGAALPSGFSRGGASYACAGAYAQRQPDMTFAMAAPLRTTVASRPLRPSAGRKNIEGQELQAAAEAAAAERRAAAFRLAAAERECHHGRVSVR